MCAQPRSFHEGHARADKALRCLQNNADILKQHMRVAEAILLRGIYSMSASAQTQSLGRSLKRGRAGRKHVCDNMACLTLGNLQAGTACRQHTDSHDLLVLVSWTVYSVQGA
eukprot:8719460-Alexandrium_andersonii.AAC.1